MRFFVLLNAIPVILACTDPEKNACASFVKNQPAQASPFCATFTQAAVTATAGLPSWASNCSYKPSMISKECSCYYTGGGGGGGEPAPTTTKTTTGGGGGDGGGGGTGPTPTGITTTLPKSSGAVSSPSPIVVPAGGNFDGGMKLYDRSSKVCAEQDETGEADTIFILESGATLSNVIIGPNQAEGVHCRGTCTLNNVWWSDVCEDAVTFKQTSGTSYINGGGAFKAADKIVQFNGRGTVVIKNFFASDYGKVVRSCGNCSGNGGPRNIVIENSIAKDGGIWCGINTNYGDTCKLTNTCQDSGKICDRYTGNSSGKEPTKIGSGPDGTYCVANGFSSSC